METRREAIAYFEKRLRLEHTEEALYYELSLLTVNQLNALAKIDPHMAELVTIYISRYEQEIKNPIPSWKDTQTDRNKSHVVLTKALMLRQLDFMKKKPYKEEEDINKRFGFFQEIRELWHSYWSVVKDQTGIDVKDKYSLRSKKK